MEYPLDAGAGGEHGRLVRDVGLDDRHARIVRVLLQVRVPADDEIVEYPNPSSRRDQMIDSFEANVWSLRFRCMNCHTEGTPQNDKLRKEQAELYASVTGVPLDQAKEIISAKSETIQRLTQLGLSPEQIRTLAADPKVKLDNPETATAIKTAALFGLDAKETAEFVKMAVGEGRFGYADNPMTDVYSVLFRPASNITEGDDLYQRHNLGPVQDKVIEALSYDNPELAAYLKQHKGTADWDITNIASVDDLG